MSIHKHPEPEAGMVLDTNAFVTPDPFLLWQLSCHTAKKGRSYQSPHPVPPCILPSLWHCGLATLAFSPIPPLLEDFSENSLFSCFSAVCLFCFLEKEHVPHIPRYCSELILLYSWVLSPYMWSTCLLLRVSLLFPEKNQNSYSSH